jgi:hypothetical protein
MESSAWLGDGSRDWGYRERNIGGRERKREREHALLCCMVEN